MNFKDKTASELKALAIEAIKKNDREMVKAITKEVQARVKQHEENGTATSGLRAAAKGLK
jgi:hypothetical protein